MKRIELISITILIVLIFVPFATLIGYCNELSSNNLVLSSKLDSQFKTNAASALITNTESTTESSIKVPRSTI